MVCFLCHCNKASIISINIHIYKKWYRAVKGAKSSLQPPTLAERDSSRKDLRAPEEVAARSVWRVQGQTTLPQIRGSERRLRVKRQLHFHKAINTLCALNPTPISFFYAWFSYIRGFLPTNIVLGLCFSFRNAHPIGKQKLSTVFFPPLIGQITMLPFHKCRYWIRDVIAFGLPPAHAADDFALRPQVAFTPFSAPSVSSILQALN
jgi:hypothetical protein